MVIEYTAILTLAGWFVVSCVCIEILIRIFNKIVNNDRPLNTKGRVKLYTIFSLTYFLVTILMFALAPVVQYDEPDIINEDVIINQSETKTVDEHINTSKEILKKTLNDSEDDYEKYLDRQTKYEK